MSDWTCSKCGNPLCTRCGNCHWCKDGTCNKLALQAKLRYNRGRILLCLSGVTSTPRREHNLDGGYAMDSLSPCVQDDNPPEKRCTGLCGRILPATLEFFYRYGNKGLRPRCKECMAEESKARASQPEVRERRAAYERVYNSRPEVCEHRKVRAREVYNPEKAREKKERQRAKSLERIQEQNRQSYHRNKEKRKQYSRQRHAENPDVWIDYRLKKEYGITNDDKREMYAEQCGLCYICQVEMGSLSQAHIDHNHTTGQIRKLLCFKCNAALGMVDESEDRLTSMISYLREHK